SAPAGSPNSKTGKAIAAWTSATFKGSGLSTTISQTAAAFAIQVPTWANTVVPHSTAKAGERKGSMRTPACDASAGAGSFNAIRTSRTHAWVDGEPYHFVTPVLRNFPSPPLVPQGAERRG